MVLTELARFAAATDPLPEQVVHHAKRVVVDWVAATVPGGVVAPAVLLSRALASDGQGEARLVPSGARASLRTAALINGTAAHTSEVDDIFRDGLYHPGAPTVAAALAAAQVEDASGAELLAAIVSGLEVSTRVAAAIQPSHYRYWHTTGTVGTLGAAAAVARLLRLDAVTTAHAIATATTMAAGLQQAFRSDSMSKPLHAGHAADAGVLAALAAAQGVTGALDILTGERGFGAATSRDVDWADATRGLGQQFNIERITVKNHACCGHTFAAIDAALEIRERTGLRPDEVASIEIASYSVANEVAGNPNPRTAFEAKFSIQYCVAVALEVGSVRLRAFDQALLEHDGIRRLVANTTVRADDRFDSLYPRQRAARVSITAADGTVHSAERLTRKGDPDAPLSDGELSEKFSELTEPVLGAERCRTLADQLWDLDRNKRVRDLALSPAVTA